HLPPGRWYLTFSGNSFRNRSPGVLVKKPEKCRHFPLGDELWRASDGKTLRKRVNNLTFFTTCGDFRIQEHKPCGERLLLFFFFFSFRNCHESFRSLIPH